MKLPLQMAFSLLFLFATHWAYAQQPLSPDILRQPIIEGHQAAGISIGATEAKVVEKMGLPQHEWGMGQLHRTLVYANVVDDEGKMNLYINVLIENNLVMGVEIMSVPLVGIGHIYKGKTRKGFGFGDPVEKVKALYGTPHKSLEHGNSVLLWYKKEGIFFRYYGFIEDGVSKWPTSIVILRPGQSLPQQLREEGGPLRQWD